MNIVKKNVLMFKQNKIKYLIYKYNINNYMFVNDFSFSVNYKHRSNLFFKPTKRLHQF